MTTIDRLQEIARQSLKALVHELEHRSRHDDAMHALTALTEIEKIAPLNVVYAPLGKCGAKYESAGGLHDCTRLSGHELHSDAVICWGGIGSGLSSPIEDDAANGVPV